MGHGRDFDRRGWMTSGKAELRARSINKRAQENAGCPGGGGCIGAESKDGCAPNSNFRLLPQATLLDFKSH